MKTKRISILYTSLLFLYSNAYFAAESFATSNTKPATYKIKTVKNVKVEPAHSSKLKENTNEKKAVNIENNQNNLSTVDKIEPVSNKHNNYKLNATKTLNEIDLMLQAKNYTDAKNSLVDYLSKNPNDSKARTMLGSILSEQYKLDGAQREFVKSLAIDPNNAVAHDGLGLVLYKKTASSNMEIRNNLDKYYKKSLNEFEAAIKADPNYYKAYNNAGKILEKIGRINEAEKYYKKALEIEPKYDKAIVNLGNIYYIKGQLERSLQKFQEALEIDSKNSTAYYNLGKALIAKGQYSKAIKYLQTALYLFPNSAPVHDMLGKAYEFQGNEAAAITSFKKASLIQPEFISPYLKLADIYRSRGDNEIAISELKTAVSANPDFLEGKLKIADISMHAGKFDQAIKYYKEVMDNQNYRELALKGLASAYFIKAQQVNSIASITAESEYVEAENNIKQALLYNPNDLRLYLALLKISRLTNNDMQSELYLSKILNISTNKAFDSSIKAQAFQAFKRYNEAKNEYSEALSQASSVEETLILGEILILSRQYQIAKEAFNKVLAESPNNTKAIRSLQRIHKNEKQARIKLNISKNFLRQKQYGLAIESLKGCLNLNPYLTEAQLLLAKTYEKQKYYFNALEHYNAYLSIEGNVKDSKKYKKKVNKLFRHIQKLKSKNKPIKKYTIL